MAKWSRNLFDPVLFAGCYVLIVGFCLASIGILRFVAIPRVFAAHAGPVRPLSEIVRQPAFFLAAPAGMIAYGTMSLMMTATPIAMLGCSLSFEDAAFVIQWHALGMYAPSFVTGHLIDRFGALRIMLCGVALLFLCSADSAVRHRRHAVLGGARAARNRLEFPLHRLDDAADRGL